MGRSDDERIRRYEAKKAARDFETCPVLVDTWDLIQEILEENGWQKPEPLSRKNDGGRVNDETGPAE